MTDELDDLLILSAGLLGIYWAYKHFSQEPAPTTATASGSIQPVPMQYEPNPEIVSQAPMPAWDTVIREQPQITTEQPPITIEPKPPVPDIIGETAIKTNWSAPGVSGPWSMGFWTPWGSDPVGSTNSLEWGALSHLIMVGVEPQSDGSLFATGSTFDSDAAALISNAHGRGVQVLLNIWASPGADFQGAVTNNLAKLVANIVGLVNQYGFDGIDIDWEAGLNFSIMGTLLSALKPALGSKLLTTDAIVTDSQFWASVAHLLDRVNVMTYDLAGTWNPYSWFNSALYSDPGDAVWSIDLAKRRFSAAGVSFSKLNIGIPFYGWSFSGGGITGPRQAWGLSLPSMWQVPYSALAAQSDSAAWDSDAHVPFLKLADGWVTFDNARSITDKIRYVKDSGLGGWIIWALDQDLLNGKHVLMEAIRSAR